MIKVIHKKNSDKYKNVFYIGRGSVLGNPYTSIQDRETKAQFVVNTKEESIEKYKEYLNDCIKNKQEEVCNLMNQIFILAMKEDVYLSCYCKPKSCHGDVIKEILESKMQKKESPVGTQLNLF